MQDVVIIPTFDRPEMLWHCLAHIAASPDHKTVELWIYVDNHIGQPPPPIDEIMEVVRRFPQLTLQVKARQPHQFHGNSLNVLMAYKDAYVGTDARLVFMIEDDVFVHPEFFAWHRKQHAECKDCPSVGCSIGVVKEPQHGPYVSLGVCFKRETLKMLLPHCRVEYFQHMRVYCRQFFPPASWDSEQDGLVCRLLVGQKIVWATTSMAQHVGWYGYHRKRNTRPQGTLEERFDQVRQVLTNPVILRVWQKEFGDVIPLAIS